MNCIISFGKDYNYCYTENIDCLTITNDIDVKEILELGFLREDVQSLFEIDKVEYLTSYPIYFRDINIASVEYKNKKEAITLVFKLCNQHKFNISEEANCFDYSFPKIEFELYSIGCDKGIKQDINLTSKINDEGMFSSFKKNYGKDELNKLAENIINSGVLYGKKDNIDL